MANAIISQEHVQAAACNAHNTVKDLLAVLTDDTLSLQGKCFMEVLEHFEIFTIGDGICYADEVDFQIEKSQLRIGHRAGDDKLRTPTLPYYCLVVNTAEAKDNEGKHWILLIYSTDKALFGIFDTYNRSLGELFKTIPNSLRKLDIVILGGGYQTFFSIACGYYVMNFLYELSAYKNMQIVADMSRNTLFDRSKLTVQSAMPASWEIMRIGIQNDINTMREFIINFNNTNIKHTSWFKNVQIRLIIADICKH